MGQIALKPVFFTPALVRLLEKRGLIASLKPTRKVLVHRGESGVVDTVYSSSARFGSHKLICVGLKTGEINLNSHPDNEEFIIINPNGHVYKPFLMIIGMHKHKELESRARDKHLCAKDFVALRVPYNHPQCSIFTMLKGTVHCECTVPGSKGMGPIFYVAEPSNLHMRHLRLHGFNISLSLK
jgi:hypothetical protein